MDKWKRGSLNYSISDPAVLVKKLVAFGDGACGKTYLLKSFNHGKFSQDYTTFDDIEVQVKGQKVKVNLVDATCYYDRLYPLYGRDADIVLMCFSISDPTSLSNVVNFWKTRVLDAHCKNVPIILVGNKKDLRRADQDKFVKFEDAKKVAHDIGAIVYVECSAIYGEGITDLINSVAQALTNNKLETSENNKKKGRCLLS